VTTPPVGELIDRYQQLSTPVVYDILDQLGHPGQAMAVGICPLASDMIVAGPAFTIAGETDDPTRSAEQSPYQIFRDIVPDSVIVMATAGHRQSGPWGENTSITAQMRGARGIVIDGGTRDANAIIALGFPTFCRYVTPVFAQGRFRMSAHQQPVEVAGQLGTTVTVRPGDFVMADRDGVVVVPAPLVGAVLAAAEHLEEVEGHIRAALLEGEDREAVYRRYPKFDHLRKP
jgi:regulator of RNase E activity RraA